MAWRLGITWCHGHKWRQKVVVLAPLGGTFDRSLIYKENSGKYWDSCAALASPFIIERHLLVKKSILYWSGSKESDLLLNRTLFTAQIECLSMIFLCVSNLSIKTNYNKICFNSKFDDWILYKRLHVLWIVSSDCGLCIFRCRIWFWNPFVRSPIVFELEKRLG